MDFADGTRARIPRTPTFLFLNNVSSFSLGSVVCCFLAGGGRVVAYPPLVMQTWCSPVSFSRFNLFGCAGASQFLLGLMIPLL